MKFVFCEKIEEIVEISPFPIYAVGGYVRNALIGNFETNDLDLASPMKAEEFIEILKSVSIVPTAYYKRTGTVMFKTEKYNVEFTSFRKEIYAVGGKYMPEVTEYTSNVIEDARRRDFKCNAIYLDLKTKKIIDPLNGVDDIKNRVLNTVVSPEIVFSHDGLRLIRLARFSGELGFLPTKKVFYFAKKNACNIKDISSERFYTELLKIINYDKKYSFSPQDAHLRSLKILNKIGVFDEFFSDQIEIKNNKKIGLSSSVIKALEIIPKNLRLETLFFGLSQSYKNKYGASLLESAEKILKTLKLSLNNHKKLIFIIENINRFCLNFSQFKLRLFCVHNKDNIEDLFKLKEALYTDNKSEQKNFLRCKNLYKKMLKDGTPFDIKSLKITSSELIEAGISGKMLGEVLKYLLEKCILNPNLNKKDNLLELAKNYLRK